MKAPIGFRVSSVYLSATACFLSFFIALYVIALLSDQRLQRRTHFLNSKRPPRNAALTRETKH